MPKPKPLASQCAAAQRQQSADTATSTDDRPKPDPWWKSKLLYPLAAAIVASIPTWVEGLGSLWLKVPFGQYRTALKEKELWENNIECAAAPFDGLKNKNNIEVDAVVCQSGHVLVRVKSPESRTTYKWVPLETAAGHRAAIPFMSTAYAQSLGAPVVVAQANFVVICQQWIGNGLIRRRIRNGDRCFDEVVNTYTGQVVSTNPAPCNC
jgi:hypothetical protein